MTREQIMKDIAEINRQIDQVAGNSEAPKVKRHRSLPSFNWILAVACLAFYYAGNMVPGAATYHADYKDYALYAGLALVLLAVVRTVLVGISRLGGGKSKYSEHTEEIRGLQNRKQELQRQLKELDGQ